MSARHYSTDFKGVTREELDFSSAIGSGTPMPDDKKKLLADFDRARLLSGETVRPQDATTLQCQVIVNDPNNTIDSIDFLYCGAPVGKFDRYCMCSGHTDLMAISGSAREKAAVIVQKAHTALAPSASSQRVFLSPAEAAKKLLEMRGHAVADTEPGAAPVPTGPQAKIA